MNSREHVALALRTLAAEGFFPLPFGHLSVRGGDPGSILILRHIHEEPLPLERVEAADIVAIDSDGAPLQGVEAPGERYIHTGIYRKRSDVGCVLHYHSRLTAALALARDRLVPRTPLGIVLGASVHIHDDGGQVDTPTKGDALAASLGDGAAVLLPGHGAVVAGSNIQETVTRAVVLEDACSVELAATQLGAPPPEPVQGHALPREATEVSITIWNALLKRHGFDPT